MKELDHRDHAALTEVSQSSPPLRAGLYGEDDLGTQLDHAMTRWLTDPHRGIRIEEETAVFPAQFETYAQDFRFFSRGASPCGIGVRYTEDPLKSRLRALDRDGCPHRFATFDHRINDVTLSLVRTDDKGPR
jgi:hypothetical protein